MFVCAAIDLQDWVDFCLAIVNTVWGDENRTCFFPSSFFLQCISICEIVHQCQNQNFMPYLWTKSRFFFFWKRIFTSTEHYQRNVGENTGRVHEIFHSTCRWSAKLAKKEKNYSALTRQCTKTLSITDSLNSNSHFHPRTTLSQCWFILLPFGNLKS